MEQIHTQEKNHPKSFLIVWAPIIALLAIAWSLYGQSLGFGFTNWDEPKYIINNPLLQRPDFGAVVAIFTFGGVPGETLYIPLTYLSYWMECQIFGLSAPLMHGVNVSLHCVNALLVFALCRGLCKNRTAAFLGAALFVAHPLQAECVVWTFGRKDLLATAFALTGLWIWLRGGAGRRTHWLCVVSTIILGSLAILSKPSMLTFPALIPLIAVFVHGKRGLSRSTLAATGISLCISICLFLANRTGDAGHIPSDAIPLMERLTLWPWALSGWLPRIALLQPPLTVYPWPRDHLVVKMSIGAITTVGVLFIVGLAVTKRWRLTWFLLAFVMITFAPTLGTAIGFREFITGDRYGYFPLLGIFLLVGLGLDFLLSARRSLGWVCLTILGVAMCWRTCVRVVEWRSSVALWSAQVAKVPNHPYGYAALGKALEEEGRKREALTHYQTAQRLGTTDEKTFYNMGNVFFEMKRFREAEEAYDRALVLAPGYVEAMVNLGRLHMTEGNYAKAEAVFLHALDFDSPHRFPLRMNLSVIYEQSHRLDKAIQSVEKALDLSPNHPHASDLLKSLMKKRATSDQRDRKSL